MTTVTADVRPDPMPAATLGMWLFLCGEAMFFAGLLTAFLVLQSSPAERALFVRSAAVVSRPLTVAAAVLLVASAATWWRAAATFRGQLTAAGLAVGFLAVQRVTLGLLLSHHTVVTPTAVYDGRVPADGASVVTGVRGPLPVGFDVNTTTPGDVRGTTGSFEVPRDDVRVDADYGPSRNNYFACFFLVTAAHALHVVGGLIASAWLLVRTRRGTTTPLQRRTVTLYWQFVNGVGLLSLVVLALG